MKPSYVLALFGTLIYLYQRGTLQMIVSRAKQETKTPTASGGGGSSFDKSRR